MAALSATRVVSVKALVSEVSGQVEFSASRNLALPCAKIQVSAFSGVAESLSLSAKISKRSAVVSCRSAALEDPSAAPEAIPEGSKLYVGNLPFNVDSESLAEIFQDAGVVELVEVIYDRDTGRSRGFGFVTMSSTDEAQSAVEKFDGSELGGRSLRVNFPQTGRTALTRGDRGDRGDRPPRGDRPSRFGGSNGNKLYVGNLSWGMDDLGLEDLFADFGKVLEAKVISDRDTGRSRGFGFVTLGSPEEANEAVSSLDGAEVDGRTIRVSIANERQRS